MKIILNGEATQIDDNSTVLQVLQKYNLDSKLTVVEINLTVLKKEQFNTFFVKEDDKIELIRFMGGG